MSLTELRAEADHFSKLLTKGVAAYKGAAAAEAEAENEYRKARARAWVTVPEGMIAKERQDWVDGESADLRKVRDLARGVRMAAIEALRSRRQQLSAVQSVLAVYKAEAEFTRTGGDWNG